MLAFLQLVGAFVAGLFTSRRRLEAENLSPIQRLAPLRPPPVNLSGRTQALGGKAEIRHEGSRTQLLAAWDGIERIEQFEQPPGVYPERQRSAKRAQSTLMPFALPHAFPSSMIDPRQSTAVPKVCGYRAFVDLSIDLLEEV